MSDRQLRLDQPSPEDVADVRRPFDELAGIVDQAPDLAAAARNCYLAWHHELGPELAQERLERHYPDQASAIIAEAHHLLKDAT